MIPLGRGNGVEGLRGVGGAHSRTQHLSHSSHRNSNNDFTQTHKLQKIELSQAETHVSPNVKIHDLKYALA